MRIVIIPLMLVIHLTALAQDALTTTYVNLESRRLPLSQAFRIIQQKSGLLFVYQPGLVAQYKDVRLPEGRYTVAAALDSVLERTYLDFTESNRNIIVFKKPTLIFFEGFVKDDETGEALPGAIVTVKNSERMTMADEKGYFKLNVLSDDSLVIYYSGMHTQTFSIPTEDITKANDLLLKPLVLDPVIVNGGYYQVTNQELTGNISTTTRSLLDRQPVSNLLQAIQASMPGVYVQLLSGLPGSGIDIQIRGSKIRKRNPLILVDGIPYPAQSLSSVLTAGLVIPNSNGMNGVSPAMIESIVVLKDADATAIYGSRGADGVILITTRRSQQQGYGIEVNVNSGISQVANFMQLLDNDQWGSMRQEAFKNDYVIPNQTTAPDLLLWNNNNNTNWQQKLVGGTAQFTDASISLHGGKRDVQVFGSYNLNKQTNVFPGDFNYLRGSGLVNIQVTPANEKLKFTASANYSVEDNKLPPIDLTSQAIALSPIAPDIFTQEGDLNWQDGTWINPYSHLRNSLQTKSNYFLASSQFSYLVLPALKFINNAGFTNIDRQEINLRRISSQNPDASPLTGTQMKSDVSSSTWIAEPQLEYAGNFKWGKITLLLGTTFQRTIQQGATLVGYGYTSDATIASMPAAPIIESYEPANSQYSYSSLFSRFSYNFKGRYLLNLSARRDASSRFAPGMIANFGALGAAWIFTREKFAHHWSFLEHGKIRVSYGTAGNDQIDDYGFLDSYATTDLTYGNKTGIYPTRIANSTYSWELSEKFEAGLQLGFLLNRVQLELAYYRNNSSRQLLGRNLAATTGFETVEYNLPVVVRNSGIELEVKSIMLTTENIRWNTNLNMSFPSNKLVRYDHLSESSNADVYMVGESINVLKRFNYLGIDSKSGNFLYEDKDGDGRLSEDDLQKTKTLGVHWYGGLENTFLYKSLQLSVTLRYVSQTRESISKQFGVPGSIDTNQPVEVMNRWQEPGDITDYHRFTQSIGGMREYSKGMDTGENAFTNANFLRVQNVSLSYLLPAKFCERTSLKKVSVYVRAQNLYTLTDYAGLDPENADIRVLPPVRTFTAGIQLGL